MSRRGLKQFMVSAGFHGLRASRLPHLVGRRLQGLGAILMFHHIRPERPGVVQMNRGLSVTPRFLDVVLTTVRDKGFEILSLDDAAAAVAAGGADRPFVAITFDDGYRDNLDHAEPVLRAHQAPYAIYATPGFVDGAVSAWWEDLEEASERSTRLACRVKGAQVTFNARTPAEKNAAAEALRRRLFALPGGEARAVAAALRAQGTPAPGAQSQPPLFMTWDELRRMADSPLCTIGAHTLAHERLSALDAAEAEREIVESKTRIERELGRRVAHFAYPYGGCDAAGPREFALAAKAGFTSAVTTRPGMLFPEHSDHLFALPRLSVNGGWQTRSALETLLSGLPFALANRGRRLNVA